MESERSNEFEDPIASAYTCTRTALEKLQPAYEKFQRGEQISETWVIASLIEAKKALEGVSDIFAQVQVPGYPELEYTLACEEHYICERISVITAYALQGARITSPPISQKVDKEFKYIFSSLQNIEHVISKFQR